MHSNKRWPVFILSIALILGILQPYPIVSAESEQTYENYDEDDKDASGETNTEAFDTSSYNFPSCRLTRNKGVYRSDFS